MSQNQGRHKAASQKAARAPGREVLDRPSLFSPAHGDADDLADMQRVHILSTLESARRPPRAAPSKMRKPLSAVPAAWQIKALMGLMAAGILALLTAFILLVLESSPAGAPQADSPPSPLSARTPSPASPIRVDRDNPLAALVASPAAPTTTLPAAQQAAIIENLPVDPTAPLTAPVTQRPITLALTEQATTHPGATSQRAAPAMVRPGTLDAMPSVAKAEGQRTPGIAPDNPHDKTSPTAIDVNKATSKRRAKASGDEDVALLEAVLMHSANRKAPAPVNVDEELQRCGQLSGGAAATCRARICVQHPTTPACHQTP